MLRTPSAIEGEGGAISENQARERNRMLQVRDQMAQLAAENGLKVSKGIASGLLPTPAVNDMGGNKTVEWWDEWTEKTRLKFNNSNGHGPSLNIEMLKLMPTPNTMDSLPPRSPEKIAESKIRTPGGYANVRETVVNELLRTPVAQEGTKAPSQQDAETKAKTGQVWLSNEAKGIANENIGWGKFEPAIRRWERVLGRPAPEPTKPDGKDDAHRLSSKFTEWMMGLPDGWITDCGLSRNEELKAAGNGVVPQQAELALRLLLEGVDWQGDE
jgi:DNA (cytosine-5)-methyltransferase 1